MTSLLSPRPGTASRALPLLALLLLAGCGHHLSAAQIAVLKSQGFQPKDDTWQLGLGDKMLFDTGSDRLKPETEAAIEHTGGALNSVGIRNVRVEGHTDNTGTPALNLDLSKRRAVAVAEAMDKTGATNPISTTGLGDTRPIAPNTTDEGRSENRRVAVIVPDNQE